MKIVLVYSCVIGYIGYIYSMPLGVGYLGTILKNKGHDVKVVDALLCESEQELIDEVVSFRPDVVGFSFMTTDAGISFDRIEKIKEQLPETTIIVGGPHATVDPEDCLEKSFVDFILIGESEFTFPELVELLEKKKSNLKTVDGVGFRVGKRKFINTKKNFIENLDDLPHPDRDMLHFRKRKKRIEKVRTVLYPYTNLNAARGCPYACRYCQPTKEKLFGRKTRFRSADNILDEIELLQKKHGLKYFSFNDDTFTLNRKLVEDFCSGLNKRGLKIKWFCQTRANRVDLPLLRKMRKAGCYEIIYGIESGSQHVLDLMDKRTDVETSRKAILDTRKAGIISRANMMIGYPGETEADMKKSVQFLKETKPDFYNTSKTSPFPGTYLYDDVINQNMMLVDDYSSYSRGYFGPKIRIDVPESMILKYRSQMVSSFLDPRVFKRPYLFRHMLRRLKCHLKEGAIIPLLIETFLDLKYLIVKPRIRS
jgi:radical SAM superfamily enzyme YgiQ (UPF0313 family)